MLILALPAWASDLDDGVAALKAKRPADAIAPLAHCVATEPDNLECRWQLGWAYYATNDWQKTVDTWSALAAKNPTYESVATQLPQAQALLDTKKLIAAAHASAPATLKADAGAIRLRAVGDMMIGTDFPDGVLPPDAGASAFANVSDALEDADFTFGNLEGPLCDIGETTKCKPDAAPGSCYAFRTPTSYAHWYKEAGFDVVSTANNHNGDFGEECRTQTEQTLDAQGIRWSGRPGTVAKWTTNGVKFALAAFHTSPLTNWLNDTAGATALVKSLTTEADVVIVSFHGGAEGSKAIHVPLGNELFFGEDRGDLRTFTHAVVDAGADLVLGHGPHVLRGMELYKDRLIAYSMGNFSTYGRFNLNGNQGIGEILEVQLAKDGRFATGRILGTRQEGQGIPRLDPDNAAADLVRALTASDFPDYGVKIAQDGTIGR
jgi:hypothetical protein